MSCTGYWERRLKNIKMIEQIFTSSVLIVAVLAVSILSEKHVNPCLKYALWLLVAVKLLIPLPEFESDISVMKVADRIEETGIRYLFIDSGMTKDDSSENVAPAYMGVEQAGERTEQGITFTDVCYGIWIIGMLLCLSAFLWSNLRFAGSLRKSRVKIGQVKGRLNVYKAAGITNPCLFGFPGPSIYLQENMVLSDEQRKYVLAHEYTHYRHGDHIWALVRCLCVIIYWFNPLVWLAAVVSGKDSETACDAGALKLIGRENYLQYGKALIEIAKNTRSRASGASVLGCSTGVAGGKREMKKRMRMLVKQPQTKLITVLLLLFLCAGIVGCTFGSAAGEEGSENAESSVAVGNTMETETGTEAESFMETGNGEPAKAEEKPSEQEAAGENPDDLLYKEVTLTRQAEADKVCIIVQPSVLRTYYDYYYIPEGAEQEQLLKWVNELPAEGGAHPGKRNGMKETGWQMMYNDKIFMAFEGGYLYELQGTEEYFVQNKELCDFIQTMVEEKLEYYSFDVADIENIVSARLDTRSIFTGNELYSQTITDKDTLRMFEEWFRNAKYIFGGADCGNQCACLELTLADGEIVRLSMATDSCSNFGINGVYYDYRPTSVWDNREFFACFDEIPEIQ